VTKKRFEDLEVWKRGCRLVCSLYELTREGDFARDFALRDQIRRAAISIPSNIAEGFERESGRFFTNSLRIAKGSSGELRTQLYIAAKLGYFSREKANGLIEGCEEISRMLSGLIRRLKSD
jgi:four helix bundle protein